jgi:hypothetical protein
MKHLLLFIVLVDFTCAFSQRNDNYYIQLALQANIKRPVPPAFAFKSVRVPVKTDSISLAAFHAKYYKTMVAGTVLLSSGILITLSHIVVAAAVPHFNRNMVISLAAIGVGTATSGSITLPLGASERHRYKRTLKIELAKRGL